MSEYYEEEMIDEVPQGVKEDSDLIDKLITPDERGIEGKNPLISRDTILANFNIDDIEILKLYNDIYELGQLANNNYTSWNQWLNSIGRRMKLVTLLTRGKQGFQNQMLKTTISIQRRGVEQMPEEYD